MRIYRDKRTGRFASAKSWRRSHGRSGRYARQTVHREPRRAAKAPVAAPPLAGTGGVSTYNATGVPVEFLEVAEEFFESGYEAPEEEEYA
jgi:hypothetical protein